MIHVGKYKLCLFDLVVDSRTGRLDGMKLWNHTANIIMSKAMLTNTVTWELMAAYGAIVGGSHVAMAFLKYKYRDGGDNADKPAE